IQTTAVDIKLKEEIEIKKEPIDVSQNSYFIKHQIEHSVEKSYQCSDCLRTHFDEKPYQYNQCNGEKPYQCTQREKAFSKNTDITRHHRVHSGEKPHQCT
ncbi:unnamed protein product, partial [Meganyctiphanes norvegica]